MPQARAVRAAALSIVVGACVSRGTTVVPASDIPVPVATGPLALHIAYPRQGITLRDGKDWVILADTTERLEATDSAFVFGTVGRGDAHLMVNGVSVAVHPAGGWIAWLPLPRDTVARFQIVASTAQDTVRATFLVPMVHRFEPPAAGAWIDTTSFSPSGSLWNRPDESIALSVRASPNAQLRVVFSDGQVLSLVPVSSPTAVPAGQLAFGTQLPSTSGPVVSRYSATWAGRFGPDPGDIFHPAPASEAPDSAWAVLEAIVGGDTTRARWPLRVGLVDPLHPRVVRVDDDPEGTGVTDSVLAGRPAPYATYYWFFPNGTIAAVDGRSNDQVRLRLSRASAAWVDGGDLQPLPEGTPPPRGRAGSLRLFTDSTAVTLRIPLQMPIPFRVDEDAERLTLTLYGVAADMDFMQYGPRDSLVDLVSFQQPAEDEARIVVQLHRPVWGYRTVWSGSDLLLVIRRPPRIDRRHPLAGRRIAVDPGHPPLGAVGPTGVREPDVTLAVGRKVQQLLEAAGATVIMLRTTDAPVSLAERPMRAARADADVLVSIHANALPDGVNPFNNNGTSVYYFQPRSLELARALDSALVAQFGFRDLGIGRGDLALARPTWMPSALCEGLFLMLPDQEAVLASETGQWHYARGVVDGIRAFLRTRAGR